MKKKFVRHGFKTTNEKYGLEQCVLKKIKNKFCCFKINNGYECETIIRETFYDENEIINKIYYLINKSDIFIKKNIMYNYNDIFSDNWTIDHKNRTYSYEIFNLNTKYNYIKRKIIKKYLDMNFLY